MLIGDTIARPAKPDDISASNPNDWFTFLDPKANPKTENPNNWFTFIDPSTPAPGTAEAYPIPNFNYTTSTPQSTGPVNVPEEYFSTKKAPVAKPVRKSPQKSPDGVKRTTPIESRPSSSPRTRTQVRPFASRLPQKKSAVSPLAIGVGIGLLALAYFVFKE